MVLEKNVKIDVMVSKCWKPESKKPFFIHV
jgi:hypothetical protein